jgi:hypothetical protein
MAKENPVGNTSYPTIKGGQVKHDGAKREGSQKKGTDLRNGGGK